MTYRDLEHYVLPKDRPVQLTVSGGRSSAYKFLHILKANGGLPSNAVPLFLNTGREMEACLRFVKALEDYTGVPITWLERDSRTNTGVRIVAFDSASRQGEPFQQLYTETVAKRRDGTSGVRPLPNPAQRTCTIELKIKTAYRYLRRHLGWERGFYSTLGYRADEPKRVAKKQKSLLRDPKGGEGGVPLWPMYDAGVDAGRVLSFWREMPFDLEEDEETAGLSGNCDLCLMKSAWKLKIMMRFHPERVPFWLAMEARNSDRSDLFRKDRPSLAQLWAEVQAGDMSAPKNDKPCGTCTD